MNLDVAQLISRARIDRVRHANGRAGQVRHAGPRHRGEEVTLALGVVEQGAPALFKCEIIYAALFVKRKRLELLIRANIETGDLDLDDRARFDIDCDGNSVRIRVRDCVVCHPYRKIVLFEICVFEVIHFVLDKRLIVGLPLQLLRASLSTNQFLRR